MTWTPRSCRGVAALAWALALLAFSGCTAERSDQPRYDPRIIGHWMSDGTKTMSWLHANRQLSPKQDAIYSALFGRMVVEYTPDTYIATLDGKTYAKPYRFIGMDHDSMVTKTYDPLSGMDEIVVINFEGDGYWVYIEKFDIREYFKPAPKP